MEFRKPILGDKQGNVRLRILHIYGRLRSCPLNRIATSVRRAATGTVAYCAWLLVQPCTVGPTCCLHLGLRQNLHLDPGRSRDSPRFLICR